MKCFICALDKIHIGIPAERTERIIQAARVQTAVYETENQEAFISLPLLFRQKEPAAPHGVVLKATEVLPRLPPGSGAGDAPPEPPTAGTGAADTAGGVKTVLLTPRIDKELDIPDETIYQLPEAFAGPFRYFSGACFSAQDVILILNPAKLTEGMR